MPNLKIRCIVDLVIADRDLFMAHAKEDIPGWTEDPNDPDPEWNVLRAVSYLAAEGVHCPGVETVSVTTEVLSPDVPPRVRRKGKCLS